MVTLREALHQRVPRVRKLQWADPNAYLRLPLRHDGMYGPWAELYDDRVQQEVLGVRPGSQRVLVVLADDDDPYEIYTGPVSEWEQHSENYARGYAER